MFRWLRRFVRRSTKPIPHGQAHIWNKRLSLAYGFFAWNALAVVVYAMYTGKRDWASFHGLPAEEGSPAVQFSRMMDIPKAKVFKFSGLSKTEEFEIDNTTIFDSVRENEQPVESVE